MFSLGRRPSTLGHILGYARLTDIDSKLEKLSMDPRRSPQWVCDTHLSDQSAYFQRQYDLKPARCQRTMVSGFTIANALRALGKQSKQTNEHQSVGGAEGEFSWSSPPQNVYSLPQCPNLCLEHCPRPTQIDDHPNQSACIDPSLHRSIARFSVFHQPD
jgi:hypothetical protein